MFFVWLIGFFCTLAFRAYKMSNIDFSKHREPGEQIFFYWLMSFGAAITWFLTAPLYGIYKLGQKKAIK